MNKLQRIEEMEQQLAALKAEVETEKQEPMFPVIEPQQDYYFVNAVFAVGETFYGCSQDKLKICANNAYPESQKDLCKSVAKHMADTNWFIRKAIEFAQGYEFKPNTDNYCVMFNKKSKEWIKSSHSILYVPTTVYMAKEQADKFISWLEKHKPEGI